MLKLEVESVVVRGVLLFVVWWVVHLHRCGWGLIALITARKDGRGSMAEVGGGEGKGSNGGPQRRTASRDGQRRYKVSWRADVVPHKDRLVPVRWLYRAKHMASGPQRVFGVVCSGQPAHAELGERGRRTWSPRGGEADIAARESRRRLGAREAT